MMVPTGTDERELKAAFREFEEVVGREWVFTSAEDIEAYRDSYSPHRGGRGESITSGAVAPIEVEQIQQIVHIANRRKVPLYPISTGKNLGYGGPAPNLSGSVVIDLKRMNRILEVDERQQSCLVEPGVSYFDMYRHLRSTGSRLWIDVPDPGWGSMIGNALDRGVGYTMAQFRSHFDAHCGMEVVLPNGEVIRTGMGAMPGARTWQQHKVGFGPWIDGIFSQSNFGIVTKMGFWLMQEPEAYLKGTVFVSRHEDLVPLVDELNILENSRIFQGFPDLASPLLAVPPMALMGDLLWKGPPSLQPEHAALLADGASPERLERFGRANRIPFWSCSLGFYGPEAVIRSQWAYAQEKIRHAIPGATFSDDQFFRLPLPEEVKNQIHQVEFGVPNLKIFGVGARTPWNPDPGHGHMFFSPIIPRTGEAIIEVNRVVREASRELGIHAVTAVTLPMGYFERAFVYIVPFPISEEPETNRKNRESFRKLIRLAAENGWGEYRTPAAFQDDVMRTYSFNGHVLRRFLEEIKDAIDPNGIISPGRYGIWPARLRNQRRSGDEE